MKFLNEFWNDLNIKNNSNITTEKEILEYFKSTLQLTNKTGLNYMNDWKKIYNHVDYGHERIKKIKGLLPEQEKIIQEWNDKIKSVKNFDYKKEFETIIDKNRNIIPVLKDFILLARDESSITVKDLKGKEFEFNFLEKEYTDQELKNLYKILELTDFYYPFANNLFDNVRNSLKLILLGLDSNARKNRSGNNYQYQIGTFLTDFCRKHQITNFSEQINKKNFKKIMDQINKESYKEWGEIFEKEKPIPDFAFEYNNKKYIIEYNYADSGSKLVSEAGNYIRLDKALRKRNIIFIYITDGKEWIGEKSRINKPFNEMNYILNYRMLEDGILDYIIKEEEK
jgi:type II restriction enzyme